MIIKFLSQNIIKNKNNSLFYLQPQMEMVWAMKAHHHAETYFKVCGFLYSQLNVLYASSLGTTFKCLYHCDLEYMCKPSQCIM